MDNNFFKRDWNEGQMSSREREFLFNLVLKEKPLNVFEVGTWKGGGSTYYIAAALKQNGKGMLYTVDATREFFDFAYNLYNTEFVHLKEYVNLNFGLALSVFPNILLKVGSVDLLVLDGPEDPKETLAEYRLFDKYMPSGSYLACHDWEQPKMSDLKKEVFNKWEITLRLNAGSDVSVTGFAIFKKK